MQAKVLNANVLKLIAIIAMTLDHLAKALYAVNRINLVACVILQMFGQITMPIMCFFIAEGYRHTRDWRKYLIRLFVFAFVSHFAFVFLFNYQDWLSFVPFAHGKWQLQTSVMWGLVWGLILIRTIDSWESEIHVRLCLVGNCPTRNLDYLRCKYSQKTPGFRR